MSTHYEEIMATKPYLPFRMNYLTDWMIKKAKEELNETDTNRKVAIVEFRKLIAKEKDLKCWTDDEYLLQFLRARKFNVEKAMERLLHFYTVKRDFPEVYTKDMDHETIRNFFETGVAGILPYRDDGGCSVAVFTMSKWDVDIYPMNVVMTMMTATVLCCVEDPATQVCGMRLIIDVKGATLKQIRAISPRYIQLFSYALRNTLPVRFKGIHIVNESALFTTLYGVLKIFLTEKIRKRFHFHGENVKHLQKFVPKAILPGEYNGDNVNYCAREWCQKEMVLYYPRYAEMHHQGYC